MKISFEQIIDSVREAGIIGCGGAGFPTYVKLQSKVDIVLANGSECEPLLNTDKTLMREHPELVIEGIQYAMQATGATKGIIAVKEHYKDVIASLEKVIPKNSDIHIHKLQNYYPGGDEYLTVYDATGRIIPEGGIPLNVGVLVSNVLTFAQIPNALNGKYVTERILSIVGEVENPQVLTVPIGTSYADTIKIAGGFTTENPVVIDGGPMMGNIVEDINAGIAKTTGGILVLPQDHLVVRMKKKSLSLMIRQSKAACCQCMRCTDLCPRNLLGHELHPHMTMRTIDYNFSEPSKYITSAFLCSQCSVCEMIACDIMSLSPKKIFAEYKKLLIKNGIKNPHNRTGFKTNSEYSSRKTSIAMIMKKIDVSRYSVETPYKGKITVSKVRIPIRKHIGSPAKPLLEIGNNVRINDMIAATPKDKLGTTYHASIVGKITDINEDWIEISSVKTLKLMINEKD